MKLILLRHAKSDWSSPADGDHDRTLNDRGRDDAPKIGRWLRARGHAPTRILCSTARRTRETLARMRLQGGETRYLDTLYLADAPAILRLALAEAQGEAPDCLLIVGHNPGIAQAAARAVSAPPDDPEFPRYPTASCTVIDASGGLPGPCLDFTTPAGLT